MLYKWNVFSFGQIFYSILPVRLQRITKNFVPEFFKVSIDHLFDKKLLGKKTTTKKLIKKRYLPSAVFIALMLVAGPSKCVKQLIQIEFKRVRISTGRKQTRWPFRSMAKDLNSGLLWTNPALRVRGRLRITTPAL